MFAPQASHTNLSVSSGVVFVRCADQLRKGGMSIDAATRQSALVRLRPILVTKETDQMEA